MTKPPLGISALPKYVPTYYWMIIYNGPLIILIKSLQYGGEGEGRAVIMPTTPASHCALSSSSPKSCRTKPA